MTGNFRFSPREYALSELALTVIHLYNSYQLDILLTFLNELLIGNVKLCDQLIPIHRHKFISSRCVSCRTCATRTSGPWWCSEKILVARGFRGSRMSRCRAEHVYTLVRGGQHKANYPFVGVVGRVTFVTYNLDSTTTPPPSTINEVLEESFQPFSFILHSSLNALPTS
jgi:hypothetical protein